MALCVWQSVSTELNEKGGKSNKKLFFHFLPFLLIFVLTFSCFVFQNCIFFCTLQILFPGNSFSCLNFIDSSLSRVKNLNAFVKTLSFVFSEVMNSGR